MRPTTDEEARAAVERVLRGPLADSEWRGVVGEGMCEEMIDGCENAIGIAADWVRRMRRYGLGGQSPKPEPHPRFLESPFARKRQEALAQVIALEAARDQRVRSFRREVLHDKLLSLAGIETWVATQAESEHGPTAYVMIPAPAGTRPGDTLTVPARSLRSHRDLLTYPVAEADHVTTRAVCIGGTLDRLRRLSDSLAGEFGWQKAEAVAFILTGAVPYWQTLTTTVKICSGPPVLCRIALEVDPATSYAEVAESYRRLQQRFIGSRQYRSQSEKHLNLAVFLHAHQPQPKWAHLMSNWNREHPDRPVWQYSNWRTFARDAAKAHERLLNPWPSSAPWRRDTQEAK
ncbi:MAG: hypothetical protein JW990_09150 [Thermoleophilia bacterium]|nr:hypothetical protein [Thermoleophilia bacterium]